MQHHSAPTMGRWYEKIWVGMPSMCPSMPNDNFLPNIIYKMVNRFYSKESCMMIQEPKADGQGELPVLVASNATARPTHIAHCRLLKSRGPLQIFF